MLTLLISLITHKPKQQAYIPPMPQTRTPQEAADMTDEEVYQLLWASKYPGEPPRLAADTEPITDEATDEPKLLADDDLDFSDIIL